MPCVVAGYGNKQAEEGGRRNVQRRPRQAATMIDDVFWGGLDIDQVNAS